MTTAYSTDNTSTICAISTPSGRGGIAVARVSGKDAIAITAAICRNPDKITSAESHTAHLATICDSRGEKLDQAVITVFHGPRSFTGEDVTEISVHGSVYIQQELLKALVGKGCRLAEPGEFTRRAFINNRLDLAEAEAVADIIATTSRAAHRLAIAQLDGRFSRHINTLRDRLIELASLLELELDFSEEDVTFADRQALANLAREIIATTTTLADTFDTGSTLREGIPVAIIGLPNAGKSSLLNAILGHDRAIVSNIPGTTRDTIEETVDNHGITLRFIDTAGIRHSHDTIETLGIDRSIDSIRRARIILWLITPDRIADTAAITEFHTLTAPHLRPGTTIIPILNKIDLAPKLTPGHLQTLDTTLANLRDANVTHPSDQSAQSDKSDPQDITLTPAIPVSALLGTGIDDIKQTIARVTTANLPDDESMIVTNQRHYEALRAATDELRNLLRGLTPTTNITHVTAHTQADDLTPATDAHQTEGPTPAHAEGLTPDLLALHLRAAIDHLSAITGTITTSTILNTIFQKFCIGK